MDGQSSTANVSSVGTPMASGHNGMHGSTKLKLTFNANTNGSGTGSNGGGNGTTTAGGTDSGVGSDED
jgi:hypothetical protein